jgi:hypothetical protein
VLQKVALWVCGLIAGGIIGALASLLVSDGAVVLGLIGGMFAFATARLWFTSGRQISN